MTAERSEGASFANLLRTLRERAGLSQSALARRAGLDPSFVNRLESGQRTAERSVVEKFIAALELDQTDADLLMAAGGLLPTLFDRVGLQDPTLQLVVQILSDERLSPEDREEFREVIRLIGRRYRPRSDTR
jgi:transcriptional regulator with XRE-family HTH domain